MVTKQEAILDPRENLGRDIKMINNDIVISSSGDLDVTMFEDNLKQAIYSRLQTVLSEMEINRNYGSKIKLLLGEPRTEILKNEIKNEILFTLFQEPRIIKVENINIVFDDVNVDRVSVSLDVIPIKDIELTNMVFELFV